MRQIVLFFLFLSTCYLESSLSPDAYIQISNENLLSGVSPKNKNGSINVIIEIPTGTTAKWEVSKPDGNLKWEIKKGKPRQVAYLGYPGNYGMIPRSLLPKSEGGDGDPLDVLVLGPPVPRGSIVEVKLIGVLKLLDRGEHDDKLIAVMAGTPFAEVDSIATLDRNFPGVTTIIQTWFANYKGRGKMKASGFEERLQAERVFKTATRAYLLPVKERRACSKL